MTAPQTTPGNDPEMRVRGGEKDAALLGLVIAQGNQQKGQQVLGTCSPVRRARLYLSRFLDRLKPCLPEVPDDVRQSIDEQTRVRTEWIRNHRNG